MKRKNVLAVTTAAIMALAGYLGYANSHHQGELSDIQLENIEALALGEFVVGKGWECYDVVFDDLTNPSFIVVFDCKTCTSTTAVYVNRDFDSYCTLSGMYD